MTNLKNAEHAEAVEILNKVVEILKEKGLISPREYGMGESYWCYSVQEEYTENHTTKGLMFNLSKKGKATVTGCYSHHPYYNKQKPTISFSLSKGPEKIAKDIETRFLPEYRELWDTFEAKRKEQENAEEMKKARIAGIVNAIPHLASTSAHDTDGKIYIRSKGISGDIRVGYNGESVRMDIHSISNELFTKFLELLIEYKPED